MNDLLRFEATAPLRKKRVLNIDDFLIGFFADIQQQYLF